MKTLYLFYEEPDPDRWLPFDHYPRQIIRRIIRGKPSPGGQARVFLNLCAGLDKLNIPYKVNDYRYIQQNPSEVACIIGKPHLLDKIKWKNPILFGASVFSHPIEEQELFNLFPIANILVPGEWMRRMFEPYYGNKVLAWPVGIDTDKWTPTSLEHKDIDILLYDKVRWEHERYKVELINPIQVHLKEKRFKVETIRYGFYTEEDFHSLLNRSKAMIFLCEHETQGIAYQQALSCNVPILAWDRGGFWQDPSYYPHKVKYSSVSSVPYWDERCGNKFKTIDEFFVELQEFLIKLEGNQFSPRNYILNNLTLEKCAQNYIEILQGIQRNLD